RGAGPGGSFFGPSGASAGGGVRRSSRRGAVPVESWPAGGGSGAIGCSRRPGVGGVALGSLGPGDGKWRSEPTAGLGRGEARPSPRDPAGDPAGGGGSGRIGTIRCGWPAYRLGAWLAVGGGVKFTWR